jgi:hypothetical protein
MFICHVNGLTWGAYGAMAKGYKACAEAMVNTPGRNSLRRRQPPRPMSTAAPVRAGVPGRRGPVVARVRQAFEAAGRPEKLRPASFAAMKEPARRALHPVGQIAPTAGASLVR